MPDEAMIALVSNRNSGLTWRCVFCERKDKKRKAREVVQPRLGGMGSRGAGMGLSSTIPEAGQSTHRSVKRQRIIEVIELGDDEVEEVSPATRSKAAREVKRASDFGAIGSSKNSSQRE